jgi:hypothetical protein
MKLSLLENPINLFLPRKEPDPNHFESRNISAIEMNFFLKPVNATNTTMNMRYHTLSIPSPYVTVTIILIPQEGEQIEVFIRARERPTPLQYFYRQILPDLSSCDDKNVRTFDYKNCTKDPYKLEISSNTTRSIGLHYIGLRHVPQQPHEEGLIMKLNASVLNEIKSILLKLFKKATKKADNDVSSKLNSPCKSHNGRQKRSCVGAKEPPTTPPNILTMYPAFDPITDVKYHLSSFLSSCLFWSEEEEEWKSDGCRVRCSFIKICVHSTLEYNYILTD